MSAIDALQNLQNDLIRKSTDGSVFIAATTATTIDELALFDGTTGDLVALPAGYSDLGYLTDSGGQFARAITESAITSWQSVSPTRSDTTADVTTLQVSCQETKLATIGLYTGIDPTTVTPTSNGVVRINKPATPVTRHYRVLSIAVDEQPEGEIVIARYLPNAKVTNFDAQNFDKSDNAIAWPVTFTGFVDNVVGTAESYLFGGAGWKARLAAMGLTAAAATVPVITGINPTALNTAGGQLVEIDGRGFTGTVPTTGVKFLTTNATNWKVVNDRLIVATAPAHAAGTGSVVVTNAVGASTTGPTVTYS